MNGGKWDGNLLRGVLSEGGVLDVWDVVDVLDVLEVLDVWDVGDVLDPVIRRGRRAGRSPNS